ncbi:MAG: sensor histidine kinase [Bacteroidetes bacterium]|nr:sensor histidine kinase [Bacteroidota bacterium]
MALTPGCSDDKVATPSSVTSSPAAWTKDTAAVSAYIIKANTFVQSNFDSMQVYGATALEIARRINYPTGIARALAVEANYQRRKGNYPVAIRTGLEVIRMYDSLKDWTRMVGIKNLVADFYKEMGGEKGTAEYQRLGLTLSREAQELAEKQKDIPGIISSLNEQGIILRDISQTTGKQDLMDSAYQLYKKGIDIILSTGKGDDQLGKLYNNISQVYNEYFNDYPKALDYQMKAVAFNKERNNRLSLTHNYNTIAEIYSNMGNYPEAKAYAFQMIGLGKSLNAPFRLVNGYKVVSEVYRKMNRFDSALYFFELKANLSDSLNNLQRSNQIAEMQTKFETAEKEEQIGFLDNLNRTKSQRLWLMGGAAGLLLLLLTVVWIQKRKSQQQQVQIQKQSEKLQWMMKELHHRVKNNLQIVSSLLNLQSYRLKDEESAAVIKESQLRVQAMSLMHQRLYQVEDVTMVNFKLYLTDLTETLMQAYGYHADTFDLQIRVDKEMLDVDTVMPLGLLVNEIITNAFKYAYAEVSRPALTITLTDQQDTLRLDLSDNGPGMKDNGTSHTGFGKKLIQALTKQLKATCTIHNEGGTHYTLLIPQQTDKAA